MAIKKIKILEAVLEIPAKQHCQFSQSGPNLNVNGLDWQCYLDGSSKTAPRILIFSMAMGADYSVELIFNEICAPQFKWLNKSFLGSVSRSCLETHMPSPVDQFFMGFKNIEHYENIRSGFYFAHTQIESASTALYFNKNDKRPCSYSCMLRLIRKHSVTMVPSKLGY